MKIAVVCPYDLDVPGGVQGQAVGISAALAHRGHPVTLVAPGRVTRPDESGVETVLVGRSLSIPVNGSVAPIAPFPGAIARAARVLRSGGYDVVQLHEPFVPGPCSAALVRPRAPLVGTFHRSGAGAGYRALRPALAPVARRFAARVAVSPDAAATLRTVAGADCVVIGNGVDPARFQSSRTPHGVPRIVFVGRHEQRKGVRVLLEAVASLPDELELCVIGSGPETLALRAEFTDRRVRFLGRLADDALAAELAPEDLFVAPALGGESFGVVLLEAMAARCSVVASDLPGFRIAGGDVVHYVPPGDRAALAEELRRLLADPAQRRRDGELGAARAEEHSFGRLAAAYEALYLDVLGAAGRGPAR